MLNLEEIFAQEQILNKKILIITMFGDNRIVDFFKNKEADEVISYNNILSNHEKQICQIEKLSDYYQENYFDIIIIKDGLETAINLIEGINTIKKICKETGIVLVLTRTPNPGNDYIDEQYENDSWRFTYDDLLNIFSDFKQGRAGGNAQNTVVIAEFIKPENYQEEELEKKEAYHCRLRQNVKIITPANTGFFNSKNILDNIGKNHATDKCSVLHNYLDKYDFILNKFTNSSFNLLELGVFFGSSLKMWKEYFPHAKIFGIDINPKCMEYSDDRIEVLIGDLSNVQNLIELKKLNPTIIIDDASHLWSHQAKAILTLFSCLPSGGVYIMEDLGTSLNTEKWTDYNDYPISGYDICQQIAEVATGKTHLRKQGLYQEQIEQIGMQTEMISFIKGSCIIIKK